MYFKRFAQLFIIFFIAGLILVSVWSWAYAALGAILAFILSICVAYVILILPLVILTIAKSRKKANIVGTQTERGELAGLLKTLPGFIALSVRADNDRTSTTIMSFSQSIKADNVFWMVAEKDTSKVPDLKKYPEVSFTTWFDNFENGARLSSNRVRAEVFDDPETNKNLVETEPNILDIHENAVNMAIIKLTIDSVLYEDFKDGIKALTLTN